MIFRVARHTNNLHAIKQFYTQVLGMQELGGFQDHDGYDGIFLGYSGQNWHLEFTQTDEETHHVFDEDDLLVLYPTNQAQWEGLLAAIKEYDIPFQTSKNPYWQVNGLQINDPDGYGIILCKQQILTE